MVTSDLGLQSLLQWYSSMPARFAPPTPAPELQAAEKVAPANAIAAIAAVSDAAAAAPGMDAEAFDVLLERRSEVGRAGEALVELVETERLRQVGCKEPARWVQRVAETDVGRGYDIASTWPGHERCIEVKTTTAPGSDFFITSNERKVLGTLGPKAWLYRVVVARDWTGDVVCRLQDPMRWLPTDAFEPVVFRVNGKALAGVVSSSP